MRTSLVFAAALIAVTQGARANPVPSRVKLCLTGSMPKAIPNYGEAFANGSRMACAEAGPGAHGVVIETHFHNHGALDAPTAMKAMLDAQCHAVLGFDFTDDLMLIRKASEANSLLVISMYGMMNDQLEKSATIRSMQAPSKQLISPLLRFAEKQRAVTKRTLVVTAVDVSELREFREVALRELGQAGRAVSTLNVLESSFRIGEFAAAFKAQPTGYDAVVLFVKTRQAAEIADWIAATIPTGRRPIILGTKFFGTKALPVFVNMLKNKDIIAFHTHQASHADPDPAYGRFAAAYLRRFKASPMGISLLAHDATAFLLRAVEKMRGLESAADVATTRRTFLAAAKSGAYAGASGVRFQPGLETSYDKIFIVKTDADGYHLAE